MKILVLNCGSSSIKYKLYNMDDNSVLAAGGVERIGLDEAFTGKDRSNQFLQRGADVVPRLFLHALIELVLLGVASFLHRVVLRHFPPVQNQVDVLGEALCQMEHLGEGRATLEAKKPPKPLVAKESRKHPAYPEVLLNHVEWHTLFACALPEKVCAFLCICINKPFHRPSLCGRFRARSPRSR